PVPRLVALLQVSYVEELRAVRPLIAGGTAGGRVLGEPGGVERRFRWLKAPLQIALGRLTAVTADLVLTPSAATAAEIRRDYRVKATPGVLPNVTGGLVIESGEPAEPISSGESGEALDEEPGYFLFVGRLRIRKGVEVLLEALHEIRERGSKPVRLLIAGDGEHRASLERRTAELDLGQGVRFLGRCDAARVRGLLRGARALVVPSIYEGMPLVVLEAMEAGVPVIASAVSGIPEVVEDGRTGWLVPPENPDRLAGALREALNDPEEAARRGAEGRRRIDECFRPAHAAATWRRLVLGEVKA
ncbi:MAG TPA: glycosyltransferase, partial [Thermoanaerobaculia bacterium]|nr:glycosyltransferase [Thermoanaerobaculia bacterium]